MHNFIYFPGYMYSKSNVLCSVVFYSLDHIQTPSNCPITKKKANTFTIMGTPYTFCNDSADVDSLQFWALLFVCSLRNCVCDL